MSKISWVFLVVLLLILVSISLMFKEPEKKKPQEARPPNIAQRDPLFAAIHSLDYATVEKLIRQRPHVLKEPNGQGGTYLNCVASTRDTKMMKLVIKLGGNPDDASSCGTTPLLMAAKQKDIAMVKTLLELGANPNASKKATSPLVTAENQKDYEMVKLLLKHGAKDTTYKHYRVTNK